MPKFISPDKATNNLREASRADIEKIYSSLDSSIECLSPVDAALRLKYYGPNELSY